MERPIIFSGPMVRAILDGRKTQTRRPVKPQPPDCWTLHGPSVIDGYYADGMIKSELRCPYGKPGNRLWVRETWSVEAGPLDDRAPRGKDWHIVYKADLDGAVARADYATCRRLYDTQRGQWRPSIHMLRWASRLTLEVVSVRVERVQDITEDDARAEGMPTDPDELADCGGWYDGPQPLAWFWTAWDAIYDAKGYGWDSNPWVWVVEFRVAQAAKEA